MYEVMYFIVQKLFNYVYLQKFLFLVRDWNNSFGS